MTRDDIIRMAREAGWEMGEDLSDGFGALLMRYTALVAAAEREACAKLCEEDGLLWGKKYAEAIRARGKA